jgi:hypothetical protein
MKVLFRFVEKISILKMTALEFKEKWILEEDDELKIFPKSQVDNLDIDDFDKQFLYLSGLPFSCAPFISFGDFENTILERLIDVYNLDNTFDGLYVIGNDGSGDPICVQDKTGEIVILNHDNDFDEIFMSSSLHQMAEFIFLVREGYYAITEKYGIDAAWNEGEATDLKNIYREKLRAIDPDAIEDGFWSLQFT